MLLPLEEEGMLKRLKIHKIEPKLMNIKKIKEINKTTIAVVVF